MPPASKGSGVTHFKTTPHQPEGITIKKTLLALFLAIVSVAAQAGGTVTSLVTYTIVQSTGALLVITATAPTGKPACNTQSRFAFDGNTSIGKEYLSLFLTAFALGKSVTIVGTGYCTLWGDSEDIAYAIVNPS